MSAWWGDVNARARGLGTHLPPAGELRALARAGSVPELWRSLGARGVVLQGSPAASAAEMDVGIRRGAPPLRLAGVVPTARLPGRRLAELARCATVAQLAEGLARLEHPAAAVLAAERAGSVPDLFRLEAGLDRSYGARALDGARRDPTLLRFVREQLDLQNAGSVLVLAGKASDAAPDETFLPGGERLGLEAFRRAARGDRDRARSRLREAFTGSPFADLFSGTATAGSFERRTLVLRIADWARRSVAEPLGPAPFLLFALRLRLCTRDLSLLTWGCALGAPPSSRLALAAGPP
jgi:hypothetical protein